MISVRRGFSTATVVACAAIAASCGGGSDSSTTDADTVPAADVATTAATEGPTVGTDSAGVTGAPELMQFTSPLVGGGELDATTLATKPTAFWFWSPT